MKIIPCIQGTAEWLRIRAGIPTSSQFDRIVTPTGKPSKSAEPYMLELLAERIMRRPLATYMSWEMQRGSEKEIEAVRLYEFQTDTETTPVGFITNDSGAMGASPDRLVGDRGLLEAKAPSAHVHMAYLLSTGGAYEAYRVQVQGQLFICEREWSDVISYFEGLPLGLIRIERDETFIDKMQPLLDEFVEKLEALFQKVIDRHWLKSEEEIVTDQLERSIPRLAPLDELVKQALRGSAASHVTQGDNVKGVPHAADYE